MSTKRDKILEFSCCICWRTMGFFPLKKQLFGGVAGMLKHSLMFWQNQRSSVLSTPKLHQFHAAVTNPYKLLYLFSIFALERVQISIRFWSVLCSQSKVVQFITSSSQINALMAIVWCWPGLRTQISSPCCSIWVQMEFGIFCF